MTPEVRAIGDVPNQPSSKEWSPQQRLAAGGVVLFAIALVAAFIGAAVLTAQREAAELLREVTPFLSQANFSLELRNGEQLSGPVCIVHESGQRFRTVAEHASHVHQARTLICRVRKPDIGVYKYVESGVETSLTARQIILEVCLIDLANPARRRVIVAISQPPSQIANEQQYYEQATHTIDDEPESSPARHDEQVLLEKVLQRAGIREP